MTQPKHPLKTREVGARRRAYARGLLLAKSRRQADRGAWYVIDTRTQTLALGPVPLEDLEAYLTAS